MGFRDNKVAQEAKELAAALDRKLAEQARKLQEQAQKEKEREEIKRRKEKAYLEIEKEKISAFEKKLEARRFRHKWADAKSILFFVAVAGLIIGTIYAIYVHEVYGLREGIVTDRTYIPAHTTIDCRTSNNYTTCSTTYHPATYSIEISYSGVSESWSVEEQEYINTPIGVWWCAQYLGYQCQGPQQNHVDPSFYSLQHQEEGN